MSNKGLSLNYENFLSIFKQTYITIGVSLISLVIGFSWAYTVVIFESIERDKSFQFYPHDRSWIYSFLPLFAIIGGLIGGYIINKLGRKVTLMISAMLFALSYLSMGVCNYKFILYIGRMVTGLGVGIGSLVLPIYICEITDNKSRGSLTLLPTVFNNIGILLCYILGSFCTWQTLALIGLMPNIIFFIIVYWIPETPRWYIHNGRHKEAYYILKYVLVKNDLIDEKYCELFMTQIDTQTKNNGWVCSDYFSKANLRPIIVLFGLMFIQQMSGISAVIYYIVKIFRESNSFLDSYLSAILISVINFLATFISIILINWIGRKPILYISNSIVTVTLLTLGVYFYFVDLEYNLMSFSWVPLVCLIIYMVGFSLGLGPIPWLLMGEIVPEIVLEITTALVTSFNFTFSFIVTKEFIDIGELIGVYWLFWSFSIVCCFGTIFIAIWVPETRNLSLRNIQKRISGTV